MAIYSTENSYLCAGSFAVNDIKEIEECYGKPFEFPKDPVHSQSCETSHRAFPNVAGEERRHILSVLARWKSCMGCTCDMCLVVNFDKIQTPT